MASFGVVKVSLWFHSSLFLYFETTEGNIIALSNALFWSRHDIASLACHNPCEWIVNFGANKYMIGSSKIFLTYSPCLMQYHVRIADSSCTPIAGIGSANCTSNITISSVLHALGFPVNLLSISALTNSLNCKMKFFPTHCIFQDLRTSKRINAGRLQDGLYILNGNPGGDA